MPDQLSTSKLSVVLIVCILSLPLSSSAQEILLEGHVDIERETPNVVIEDTSSGSAFLIATRPTASFFGTITNSNFGIRVNNTDLIRLTTALRVGIGTASPSSKLHVSGGDVRVSGGSFVDDGTTLSVPDYVLGSDYNLDSLDEVQRFIGENGHLPGVPSAAEIREKGLNISEFQMILLKKVEELTLYTISLQEEVEALQSQCETITELHP